MNKHLLLLIGLISLCLTETVGQSLSWKLSYAPRARHVNAGHILKSGEMFIFGGNPTNDSIQFIGHSTDSANTWGIKLDAPFKPQIKDAVFVNESVAYACGDAGSILKSTDAGKTWTSQNVTSNLQTRQFTAIHSISADTIIIAGGNLTNDSISTILQTVDGGSNWQIILDKPGPRLNDLHFYNSLDGIAVGDKGTVYTTNDGGDNWDKKSVPGNPGTRTFEGVRMLNKNTYIIVGGNNSNDSIQTIIKSSNGGADWQTIKDNLDPILLDIDFIYDGKSGIAVGNDGVAYSTIDTGNSWTAITLPNNINSPLNSINYFNPSNAIIGGQFGTVYYSLDPNRLSNRYVSAQNLIINNPVIGNIIFSEKLLDYKNFTLINTAGRQIKIKSVNNQIDVSHVPSGMYLLSYQDQNGQLFYQKIEKL
jgi:photosystem II stability/assembly factor-like uncharacterized protein